MGHKCCHGVELQKLNCLICDPKKRNMCKCDNSGTCELCKVFKPMKENIDKCLTKINIRNVALL